MSSISKELEHAAKEYELVISSDLKTVSGRLKKHSFRRPDSNKIIFSVSPLGAPHHKRAPNGQSPALYKLA